MQKSTVPVPICAALALALAGPALAQREPYRIDWHIDLDAGVDEARVRLEIEDGRPVRRIRFRYDPDRFDDFEAPGMLDVSDGSVVWEPPSENASLRYRVKITRARDNRNQDQSYDALMTDGWTLFRGDHLIPGMRVTTLRGALSDAWLHFDLPDGWSVNTGWPLNSRGGGEHTFHVRNPDRRFDRPTGWIMAGRLGSRRDWIGDTYFSVVGPLNAGVDRMGWLTLASLVYPELVKAFETVPPKILMVSAADPFWRGGLSAPNSFYFHAERRAVSENGTSPLLHELTHVVTRIRGDDDDDWIGEGLAEYYGVELLYRAGGFSADRKEAVLKGLAERGERAPVLRGVPSRGAVTARAAVLFHELDEEIAERSDGHDSLDDAVRLLIEERVVSLADLEDAFEEVTGEQSSVLDGVEAEP